MGESEREETPAGEVAARRRPREVTPVRRYHAPMSASPEFPSITKAELSSRLAEGLSAGITVVTPNLRLTRELAREFDEGCIARGLSVWEAADILPFSAFVTRCYEEALYAERGDGLPLLLADAQAREVWEKVIAASGWGDELLDPPQTAARALEAWRLAHAWNIAGALQKFESGEDARAFASWARDYAASLRAGVFTDAALLPGVMRGALAKKPRLLVAYAFDILPPQVTDFFTATGADIVSCAPARRSSVALRWSYESPRAELESAARWARARLEAGAARIGVVVPDLQRRRKEVVRVFSRVMRPDFNLPGVPSAAMPFNVSLGEPLSAVPLIAFALALLEFAQGEVEFEQASRLVRSPFLGGAESETASRARFDARLRRDAGATLSLPKLIAQIENCPVLRARLESVFALKPAARTPHAWAQYFTARARRGGFSGRAHARLGRISGAPALSRAARRIRAAWQRGGTVLFARRARAAAPLVCGDAVSAGSAGCAGAGAGAARIRRARIRRAVGERVD